MANDTHLTSPTPAYVERKLVAILSADVAAYSELGREAEARVEGAEVLRLNPQFSLEVH